MAWTDHPDALKIAEYRAKALDAKEHAAVCTDMDVQLNWESIAKSYYDMADRLERTPLGN